MKKTNLKPLTSLALFVGLIVGANSAAYAADTAVQPKDAQHSEMKRGHMRGIGPFEQLNLTAEQKDKIADIMKDSREKNKDAFDDMIKTEKDLHDLAWSDDFSEDKAKSFIDDKADQAKDFALEKVKTDNAIYKVLTPEQRTKFEEIRKNAEKGPRGHGYPMDKDGPRHAAPEATNDVPPPPKGE